VGSFTLTILDNIPPEADAGSDQTAEEGESVLFDGTDSSDNVEIATYTWTFTHKGTPTTLTGETVSFDFKESGTYVISLEVMDFSGNTDTDTFSVIVEKKAMEPEDNLFLWLLIGILFSGFFARSYRFFYFSADIEPKIPILCSSLDKPWDPQQVPSQRNPPPLLPPQK
jgi:hypothetical protein